MREKKHSTCRLYSILFLPVSSKSIPTLRKKTRFEISDYLNQPKTYRRLPKNKIINNFHLQLKLIYTSIH